MRTPALYLSILIFSLAPGTMYAQDKKAVLVSGDFQGLHFEQFARMVESQSAYHFYFNPRQVDSLLVQGSFKDLPLQKVLDTIFKGTPFRYTIDEENQVFVTRGLPIQSDVAEGFFSSQSPADAKADAKADGSAVMTAADIGVMKKNVNEAISSESKLYEVGRKTNTIQPGSAVISGNVYNARTGEPIVGVAIFSTQPAVSVLTDQYGYYSMSLPRGHHVLNVQGLGMRDSKYQVVIYSDGKLDFTLREQVTTLKEVVISAQKTANVNRVQMGVDKLDIQTIKQVPTVMGEADVLRVIQTLPGVKTVGEASTGFNVRGGATDQNLILFNDVTIYNPSHLFGMFSAFNPDVVKDVDLYKSSIPAKYGGRLSSVLDITSREGNKRDFSGVIGIGLLTSRLELEGPIIKNKTSFVLGARTTYADWIMNLLPDQYANDRGSFNDFDLSITHQFDHKNSLYLTGYLSNDKFKLNSDTAYGYGNRNINLKYKHTFSSKLTGTIGGGYDEYHYKVSSDANYVNGFNLGFRIRQLSARTDLTWLMGSKQSLDFGASSIRYSLDPGTYTPYDKRSSVVPDTVQREQALESAIYVADRYTITPELSINAGIRFSFYNYLGAHNVNVYAPGLPVSESNLLETKHYDQGRNIQSYQGPEYRISARYSFTTSFSMKAGYNTLRQYIHMLSNTTAIAPTDIWKLSDPNIRPQVGDQFSVGAYKNLKSNTIETSIEVYYKRWEHYMDYRSGAVLVMNHHIETDVLNSKGKAYGVELSIKKLTGKLNGWFNYTYSRTFLQTDDPTAGEAVNQGNEYPADFDIPHNFTLVGNFRVNHRFSVSMNTVYATGRPITLPISQYYYAGSLRVLYSDRNAYRIPDYIRTDLSMNIEGNHKVHQRFHNSWTIGVYNLFGRHNPYSVYFQSENGNVNGYKLSIFGSVIPFVNFNTRF
jgi:hypothetical protein